MGRASIEKVVLPKPCLALRVACVGHISVPMDSAPHVAAARCVFEALSDSLRKLAERRRLGDGYQDETRLIALTSLAAGADLLLAEAARAVNAILHVALPFSPEEFALDFDGEAAALEKHNELRGLAERTFVHDGRRGDDGNPTDKIMRNRAYQENGRTLVRHCDLLVAIWNGKEAAGVGGTAEQVEQAVRLGIPVVWIEAPTGGAGSEVAVRWIGHGKELIYPPDGLDPKALRRRLYKRVKAVLSIDGLSAAAETHHGMSFAHPLGMLEGRKPSEREQLERFYGESVGRDGDRVRGASTIVRWLTLHDWLRDWLFPSDRREALEHRTLEKIEGKLIEKEHGRTENGEAKRSKSWDMIHRSDGELPHEDPPSPEAAAADDVASAYQRAYLVPDTIATELAKAMRTLTLLVTFLAALAIACAAVALVYTDLKAHLAFAELVILGSVAVLVTYADRKRMKERWQHYRLLAELLRVNQALAPFGRLMPLSVAAGEAHVGGAVPKWVTWYVRAITREIGLASQDLSDKKIREAATVTACRDLLLGQIRYHRLNTARVERLYDVADSLGQWSVVLTGFIIVTKLAIKLLHIEICDLVNAWLTLLTVLMPVMAASVFALRHVEEWKLLGQRSRAMGDSLEASLVDDLSPMLLELEKGDSSLTMVEVGNRMVGVGRDMVNEVGNWLAVVDTKRMEVG